MEGQDSRGAMADGWPVCPECGRRRITTCPVCHTSSTGFDAADADFAGEREGPGCACPVPEGACACGPAEDRPPVAADAPAVDGPSESSAPAAAGPLVICSTCDEPFRPEFPRRCEWCGHEFPDGFEVDVDTSGEPPEELNVRTLAVLAGLIVAAIAALVYFLMVLPRE